LEGRISFAPIGDIAVLDHGTNQSRNSPTRLNARIHIRGLSTMDEPSAVFPSDALAYLWENCFRLEDNVFHPNDKSRKADIHTFLVPFIPQVSQQLMFGFIFIGINDIDWHVGNLSKSRVRFDVIGIGFDMGTKVFSMFESGYIRLITHALHPSHWISYADNWQNLAVMY
jgi:hypothetical protein